MMMTWPKKSLSGVSRTHNNGRHVAGSVEWRSISAAPRDTKGPIIPAFLLLCFALASAPGRADASWPAIPPALAQPQGKVVSVRTEPELQAAVANLASGTTILVAPGTYRLTRTLAVAGALEDVAIRGAAESRDEVVLVGAGRDNASYGNVPHGIWVSGNVKRLLVANLTIRDVYYHPICVNPGPQALRFYNVRLANGGQQLLKSNPNADGSGANDTVVEYSLLEYEPTSRDTYANAIDVHGGARWTIRNNVIRNVRAPGGRLAGPAVLLWNHSADMVVEGNTFVNCQREIALGLVTRPDRPRQPARRRPQQLHLQGTRSRGRGRRDWRVRFAGQPGPPQYDSRFGGVPERDRVPVRGDDGGGHRQQPHRPRDCRARPGRRGGSGQRHVRPAGVVPEPVRRRPETPGVGDQGHGQGPARSPGAERLGRPRPASRPGERPRGVGVAARMRRPPRRRT